MLLNNISVCIRYFRKGVASRTKQKISVIRVTRPYLKGYVYLEAILPPYEAKKIRVALHKGPLTVVMGITVYRCL